MKSNLPKNLEKTKDDITENTIAEMKKEEPIRHALLGQLLSDQQDDTEEINALSFQQSQRNIPFSPETSSIGTQTSRFAQRFRIGFPPFLQTEESELPSIEPLLSRSQQRNVLLERQAVEPFEEVSTEQPTQTESTDNIQLDQPTQTESTNETPLDQPEQRGATELVTQTESTESQPLTRETVELGFGGLTEEPIQTSVGQILPEEPISQNALTKKKSGRKPKTILETPAPPPTIIQAQETTPPITDQVRAPDQYVTERLVKDEPPGGAPFAQAEVIESKSKIPSEGEQIEEKWNELKDAGLIKTKRTKGSTRRPLQPDPDVPKNYNLLDEIRSISGYEDFKPIPKPNKPGPKKKAIVAEAIEISDV